MSSSRRSSPRCARRRSDHMERRGSCACASASSSRSTWRSTSSSARCRDCWRAEASRCRTRRCTDSPSPSWSSDGRRRRCRSLTARTAIAACEAAWELFGGVFRVLVVDNTKSIVQTADPLAPRITPAFLEYAQARGFHIDTARVRSPRDKARVERAVQPVRDDCFAGERLYSLEQAQERAQRWCIEEYGRRRHTRTQRMPLEQFQAEERPALLPAPHECYDVPLWCEPLIARDQCAQVAKALYSLPTRFVGKRLRARADRSTVRFYDGAVLVKTHARQLPGGKSIDASDYPEHKTAYALRDVVFLEQQARKHGEAVGRFAHALLEGPLPWTRMRRVYRLLGLAKRYGDARLETACATALAVEMIDVHRRERMLQLSPPPTPTPPRASPKIGRASC